jgi:Polysaccharide lyase
MKHWLKSVLFVLIAYLPAVVNAQMVSNPNILTYSGWETGKLQPQSNPIDGWGRQTVAGYEAKAFTVVTDVKRAGAKSMRMYYSSSWPLFNNKIRSELLQPGGLLLQEGQEYWIGFSIFLKDTPNNRNVINSPATDLINNHAIQWHSTPMTDTSTSGINMRNGLWQVSFGKLGEQAIAAKPIQLGVWTDFVFHVKVSKDPAVGFMQMWINGKPTDPPLVNRKGTTSNGNALSQKMGIYRGTPWTLNKTTYAEIYYDEYRLGNAKSGFTAVAPGSNTTVKML